jgi:galactose mutarotase-like enzyme
MKKHRLSWNHSSEIEVDPNGGYLKRWQIKDRPVNQPVDILYQGTELKRTGIPLLFPNWGDSGTKLRKHGFGRDSRWSTTLLKGKNRIVMTLDSKDLPKPIRQEYDYDFKTEVSFSLKKNQLLYCLSVENTGLKNMPISPGLHPYWAINHKDKTKVKTTIPGFSPNDFDWDNSPPDNTYLFPGKTEISFPEIKITIEDITPQPVVKYMVVWSQPINKPDFNFICFEPICGPAGSISQKNIVVKPLEKWRMKLKFEVDLL